MTMQIPSSSIRLYLSSDTRPNPEIQTPMLEMTLKPVIRGRNMVQEGKLPMENVENIGSIQNIENQLLPKLAETPGTVAPKQPVLREKASTMVPYTTKRLDDVRPTTQKGEGYDVTTMKTVEATRKYYQNKSKYYGQRSLNLDHLTYEQNPKWEAMPGQQNWVEKRYKETTKVNENGKYNALNEAMDMSDVFKKSKNSNSSKIINWMIKNMPDGKQTIIVL